MSIKRIIILFAAYLTLCLFSSKIFAAKSSSRNTAQESTKETSIEPNSVNKNSDSKLTDTKVKSKVKSDDSEVEISSDVVNLDDSRGILAGLDYPELQVVPRASERLSMEAQEEKDRVISPYWPVQFSAFSLIYSGIYASGKYKVANPTDAQKKENKMASQMAILTGGLWLGSTLYLTNILSYSSELQKLKKISGKDKKSQLLKERIAEEAIERPARIAYLVNTMSVISSLICSLYVSGNTSQSNPGYSNFSIALAFLPWIIDNRITMNWEKHLEYKRKIYAPLTMGTFQYNEKAKKWEPFLTYNWSF